MALRLLSPISPLYLPYISPISRRAYLEVALRLLSLCRGINGTTLVVSHQGTRRDVWQLVSRVRTLTLTRTRTRTLSLTQPQP